MVERNTERISLLQTALISICYAQESALMSAFVRRTWT